MNGSFSSSVNIPALLSTQVTPWVDQWESLTGKPLAVDTSEGYLGFGVFGARTGPMSSLCFSNVAHEMAHAIERMDANRPKSLTKHNWGLRIRTRIEIGHEVIFEPVTPQSSRREAAIVGIQQRILEMVGHPQAETLRLTMVETLLRWMPDSHLGGDTEEERRQDRLACMEKAYTQWPAERVLSAWHHVSKVMAPLVATHPTPQPSRFSPALR